MKGQRAAESHRNAEEQMVRRRGLIAGAAALTAGLLAQRATESVAANGATWTLPYAGSATTTDVLIDVTQFGTGSVLRATSNGASGAILGTVNSTPTTGGTGVSGQSFATGGGIGVYGQATDSAGYGVFGFNANAGMGVRGEANTGTGVYGQANNTVNSSAPAIWGFANKGTGVFGQTNTAFQYGVLGTTTATNSIAIGGIANTNGSSAFSGGTTNPNAFAGFFQGTVVVQGNFGVTGNKSAIIKHPKTNDYRLVYCVESPESWFEDAGEGTLAGGKVDVAFDPDFAALVHTDRYHVFLTANGDYHVHVTNRTPQGFSVQVTSGTGAAGASGTFSWRVMARRADVTGARLGKFTMPNLPLPDEAKLPKPPAK